LPIGSEIATGVHSGRVRDGGDLWQVLDARNEDSAIVLIAVSASGAPTWWQGELERLPRDLGVSRIDGLTGEVLAAVLPHEDAPRLVSDLPRRMGLLSGREVDELGNALSAMVARCPGAGVGTSLFFPSLAFCLPLEAPSASAEDRRSLAVSLLTGGVATPGLSQAQIRAINPWLTSEEIEGFLVALGVGPKRAASSIEKRKAADFRLPGQPALEALFREQILDYFERSEAYTAMRVSPPNGVLLVGAPGAGKTYAASRLAEFLGWPVFDVDIAAVGSPYIHETSRRLAKIFDDAARRAPSIVLLEEIDALGQDRDAPGLGYKGEEVGQLLRLIEQAGARGILVIATSNRLDSIDSALIRRGRFDHVFEVKLPDEAAVKAILEALLEQRPAAAGINTRDLARKLAGRPISDLRWLVDDAARAAVRSNKSQIDDFCLFGALKRLEGARGPSQAKP
jgi:hypothetical protein